MDDNPQYMIDLQAVAETARTTGAPGVIWSLANSTDLNINLVRFVNGDGVDAHTNTEVDVVCIALAGDGYVVVDGAAETVRPGHLFFLPKGAERAIHAGPTEFVYVTCHRRRQGIMPTGREETSRP